MNRILIIQLEAVFHFPQNQHQWQSRSLDSICNSSSLKTWYYYTLINTHCRHSA